MTKQIWLGPKIYFHSARSAQLVRFGGILLIGTLLQSCAELPRTSRGPDPSNASTPVATLKYRSVIGTYHSARPAEPAPWQQQNKDVSPTPQGK